MKGYTIAGALGTIDFGLLVSDNIRNRRGYWGETLEINFPKGVIFCYVDENDCGFIKVYRTDNLKKINEVMITIDTIVEELKKILMEAKAMFI